jgi:hypothetical protein
MRKLHQSALHASHFLNWWWMASQISGAPVALQSRCVTKPHRTLHGRRSASGSKPTPMGFAPMGSGGIAARRIICRHFPGAVPCGSRVELKAGGHARPSYCFNWWDGWPPNSRVKRLFVQRKYFLIQFEGPKQGSQRSGFLRTSLDAPGSIEG